MFNNHSDIVQYTVYYLLHCVRCSYVARLHTGEVTEPHSKRIYLSESSYNKSETTVFCKSQSDGMLLKSQLGNFRNCERFAQSKNYSKMALSSIFHTFQFC